MKTFITIDPRTGCHLGQATAAQARAYQAQPGHPAFRKPLLVDGVLVDEDTGLGKSHTPGRFLS